MVENLKKKKDQILCILRSPFREETHFWKCESCGSLILSDQLILLIFELRDLIAFEVYYSPHKTVQCCTSCLTRWTLGDSVW